MLLSQADIRKNPLTVLAVTSWGTACGIASYAQMLQEGLQEAQLPIDLIPDAGALDPATWANPAIAPIVASGGWCADPEPRYDIFDVVSEVRPVRDGVPSLQMNRGAISIVRTDGIAGIAHQVRPRSVENTFPVLITIEDEHAN